MARRWTAIWLILFAVVGVPAAVAAEDIQVNRDPTNFPEMAVAGESSEDSASLEVAGFVETLTAAGETVGGDPLRVCEVAAVLDVAGVELAAAYGFMRERLGLVLEGAAPDDEFGFLLCTGDDGEVTWFVWRVEDGVPAELGEVLARSARAEIRVPAIGAESSPEGWDIPHLVQLPVWFWVDEPGWSSVTNTASLGVFGVSATVTASPVESLWFVDGALVATCGQGEQWVPAREGEEPVCGVTFTEPFEGTLTSVVVYEVTVACVPAGLCAGIDLDPIRGEVSRPVRAVEAWGVVTG